PASWFVYSSVLVEPGSRRQKGIQTDDRLHVLRDACFHEVDGAIQSAVVGQGQGVLPVSSGGFSELLRRRERVKERIVGMDMEVDKIGGYRFGGHNLVTLYQIM